MVWFLMACFMNKVCFPIVSVATWNFTHVVVWAKARAIAVEDNGQVPIVRRDGSAADLGRVRWAR